MKIGFAGRWSPLDKKSWSGIYNSTFEELKKYGEVETFVYKWPFYVREWLILHKQAQKLAGKKAAVEFLTGYARYFSRQLEKDLRRNPVDIVFAPAATQLIAFVQTDIPIVLYTDATFQQLQGYYHSYKEVAAYNIRQGIALDKAAFHNAAHCMVASNWNRLSVIHDYGIKGEKISIVPFGANLHREPPASLALERKKTAGCRLLFLGVEWIRKGGDIALETFRQLRKNGLAAELTIIGCVPPENIEDAGVTVIPFLDKNVPVQANELYQILEATDFLLLPTRAECAGIVFCEASAFGIPSITTDTGGVSTYVENGINGYTLPIEADGGAYAEKIMQVYQNQGHYEELCRQSRARYEEKLTWKSCGKSFAKIAWRLCGGD